MIPTNKQELTTSSSHSPSISRTMKQELITKNFPYPLPAEPNLLSVIVPAYKCKTIDRDLVSISKALQELNRPFEIICVVDGQVGKADKTKELAKKSKSETIHVYSYQENKGKGYAIRFGMARAKGGIIAFIDAGSDLNANGLGLALEHMKWYDADIVIGSKRHKASKVSYPAKRRLMSFLVQLSTRIAFGMNVSDTQTGLKVFKRSVLEKVLPRLLVKRWAFDLEILAVANRLGFNRIFESPVEIKYNFATNVNSSSIINFAIDFFAIIYRVHLLRYYDDAQHDLWRDDPNLVLRYRS